jgi:hypothetical protein
VDVGLESAPQQITLKNSQSVPVNFSSVVPSGDFALYAPGTTCGTVLAATAQCVIAVTMRPTIAGPRTGTLTINSDTSETPNTVGLAGSGTNGVTASTTSLTFASQAVNTTSAPQTGHTDEPSDDRGGARYDRDGRLRRGRQLRRHHSCQHQLHRLDHLRAHRARRRTGSATFNNPGSAPTVVSLTGTAISATSPAIESVTPGTGTIGTTILGVVVTGNGSTNFDSTSLVDLGAGTTTSNLRGVSAGSLTVDVAIAANATPGTRTVTVTTGTETASLDSGFLVTASSSVSLATVTPDSGKQGQTLDVAIVGAGTHFQQGVTFANFGQGVAVNTLTIADQTNATANVTVSPTTAALGWRAVTLTTGGEQARLTPANPPVTGPGFNVLRGDAALTSVTPNTGAQGAPAFQVTIAGSATHFATGQTQVSFGQGILVGAIQVATPTTLSVQITVTSGAVPGDRDVAVTTDGEVATLANAFTVMAAGTPAITGVAPTEAAQGDSLSLTITAVNTTFTTDMPGPTLTLGSNILVSDLIVLNDTTVTANLQIEPVASTGDRTGTLSSGGTNLPFSFRVQSSNASIASVSPSNGPQGATIDVTVTGQGTHWQQGVTTASFTSTLCPLPVKAVTVTSETTAVLNLEIPANACAGPQPLQIATGGEIVGSSFAVYRQTPSVTVTPSTGMAGTTLTVNVLGEFSKFANGSTTATISGAGVSIQNFVVTSPTSASAKFVIAPNALTGACYPEANSGCHIVTLTTPLGDGAFEILSANFQVTSTPATLTLIDPFHASPGTSATVTIRGSNTSFAQGSTTVGFGPDITTSGLTIAGPTELTVDVSVGADAARGWRSAFVNTGAEQLTIGFRVDTADAPAIAAIAPATGSQGESGITVTISGANTNFNDSSEVIVGAGVSVFGAQVLSPTQITASIAISPTAPVGPNTVFVLTTVGSTQEIASGAGFSVLRGPALLQSVTPGAAAQNDVLSVSLVGVGTHWLQGATAADFGSGISVAQLTVSDATHATAQLIVLSTAALGSRTVSVVTDGERVFQDQAFVVEPGTPVLLNSSPNSGQQGTTFTVQTLGLFTNWQQDVTTAAYGNGVTASVIVISPTSASIEVTIDPLAFVDTSGSCRTLTITTGTEQVSLPNQLCVQPGAAVLTSVVPNAAPQSSTVTVTITGQNTHFVAGVTTADFGQGIGTSNVTVNSATSASVDVAVATGAATGFRTATLRTSGETASLGNAFIVRPTTPTLNGASPVSGQQGQSLTVHLIGQYTNWSQGTTTVTFGEGITVGNVIVSNATTLDATITIGSLALVGGRTVTVTTGGEVVSANVFGVVASGAIITQATPQSGNQGQDIVLTITGQNTHWEQGLTQFAMSGAGGDIKINYVLINGSTSATAGITISPTATLGARSIYMVTGAEAVVDAGAFVVTGGIPAIASISPGNARAGDVAVNVQIAGLYTRWLTGTTTVDFGPGITVNAVLVNNDTSITAVVDVASAASVGGRTVVVRNTTGTSTQALIGYFDVLSNTPPRPFISYLSPSSALRGQTFTITMSGQYTHWDPAPGATRLDFGDPTASGITINTFQVTSPTSARANITIASDATLGSRVLSIETDTPSGAEVVQATFSVVQETPTLTIVDPSAGMQGATLTVNIIGQYTGFNPSTTFNFGSGITVNDVEVLGPNVAQVNITISQLAILGQRFVTATTDGRLVGGVAFTVTPSQAVIVSLSPNTAKQGNSVEATVTGENTNWSPATTFTLGSGIDVTNVA